ncbi:MAG: helix-hairpin-helix domain-containing protein [Saprospiraceae bacterium]
MKLIRKDKLVAQIAKKAQIDTAKATIAYETVLREDPAFRQQTVKTVTVEKEVPVIVYKTQVKEVEVVREVPVEVLKEITLVREVEVVVTKEVKVEDAKSMKALQAKLDASLLSIQDLKRQLAAKPKTIIKEVPVEIIREIEVVKQIDFSSLEKMMKGMKTVEVSKTVIGETRTKKEGKIVSRKEVKAGTNARVTKKDDLTKIEGIGPKISELLHKGGIPTFVALSNANVQRLKEILNAAGPRYQMHNPGSWPKQAGLAAAGKVARA